MSDVSFFVFPQPPHFHGDPHAPLRVCVPSFERCIAVLAFAGCGTDSTQSENTGSLKLNLELADGITINEVDWRLSGNDMDMAGTIDTSAPGATASFEVFGLPPGDGYLVELSATDESGEVTCKGDAEFAVEVGVTTDVMVFLNCKRPIWVGRRAGEREVQHLRTAREGRGFATPDVGGQ